MAGGGVGARIDGGEDCEIRWWRRRRWNNDNSERMNDLFRRKSLISWCIKKTIKIVVQHYSRSKRVSISVVYKVLNRKQQQQQ